VILLLSCKLLLNTYLHL